MVAPFVNIHLWVTLLFPKKDTGAESGLKIDKFNTFFTRLQHPHSPSTLFFLQCRMTLSLHTRPA